MTPAEPRADVSPPSDKSAGVPERVPRFWPAILLLAGFWAFRFAAPVLELSMFQRFVSRMIVYAVFLLLFLVWWLTNRGIRWRERWTAVVLAVVGAAIAGWLSDKSAGTFAVVLLGLPYLLTLWTAWSMASRRLSPGTRRAGLAAIICLTWAFCTLVRFEGLTGAQDSDLRWRWAPTSEQIFLTDHARQAPPAQTPAAANADAAAAPTLELQPGDWPEFRGPNRDDQVADTIRTDWEQRPPKQLWRKRLGPGWSSVIVVDGKLFTQEQRGEHEAVVCYDAETGDEIWAHLDDARFYEQLAGAGPRGTPTFVAGKIYTLGATGRLDCLDAASGKEIWSRDVAVDSGAALPQWGFSDSPLVVNDTVVAFAGGEPNKGLLAYRVDNGDLAWSSKTGKNSYSSPQLTHIDGHAQILMLSNDALAAFQPDGGKPIWQYDLTGGMFLPIDQPLAAGDGKFLIQQGTGLALVSVSLRDGAWAATERWKSIALRPSLNDYVLQEQAVYGFDDGIFCCLDLETGKRRWKAGRYGHGQVLSLAAQKLLLVMSEEGEAVLVAANPDKHEELGRFAAIAGKTWNHPVIAHGRLFARNAEEIACYDLRPLESK